MNIREKIVSRRHKSDKVVTTLKDYKDLKTKPLKRATFTDLIERLDVYDRAVIGRVIINSSIFGMILGALLTFLILK